MFQRIITNGASSMTPKYNTRVCCGNLLAYHVMSRKGMHVTVSIQEHTNMFFQAQEDSSTMNLLINNKR